MELLLNTSPLAAGPLPDFKHWVNKVSEHFLKPSSGRILVLGCKAVCGIPKLRNLMFTLFKEERVYTGVKIEAVGERQVRRKEK